MYGMEPPDLIAFAQGVGGRVARANPFLATTPIDAVYVLWLVAWVALIVGAACWSFSRRDV
jgi:hypothetical protein